MILVIPEIKIRNGASIFTIKSEKDTEAFYQNLSENPFYLCKLLRLENARTILIYDLDGMEKGQLINFDIICMLTLSSEIPIQVLSAFSSILECQYLLDFGIMMIYLTDLALIYPDEVAKLIKKYSYAKIGFYINDSNGNLNFPNLKNVMPVRDYIEFIYTLGGKRFYYENDEWIKDKSSVDYDYLANLTSKDDVNFYVANAVETAPQLWEIAKYRQKGITAVIISEPLFNNNFACQKIWRIAEFESQNLKNTIFPQNL